MPNYNGVNSFNPILSFLQGQTAAEGLSKAQAEGRMLAEQEALKQASAGMGQMPYYAGFEGEPGAQRPNFLRELYASGNAKDAMAMEGFLTSSLGVNRDIRKAGEIELAKKKADYEVYSKMIKDFMGNEGTMNAFGNAMGIEPSAPAAEPPFEDRALSSLDAVTGVTPAPSIPGPQRSTPAPIRPLESRSGVESSMEITPQGPKFGLKKISPFEKGLKSSEDETRRITAQTGVDAEKRQSGADRRAAIQTAHENVRKTMESITNVQKMMQNRDISWEERQSQIDKLSAELDGFSKQRDQLLIGKVPPAPTSAGNAAPVASTAKPSVVGPPKFTEKEQAGINLKDREEQVTAANKEVVNARLGAEKVLRYKRQIDELFDLVTKNDVGHPAMEGIPLAENVLTMSKTNAQVKKLTEGIINMFAEPGQSQMMNTIVERQMQGAVVPNIFADPQLNKQNAAILRSNVEHLQNFPGFLEAWKNSHNGTLEGAADAWIGYTSNNPLYLYEKDKRGKVHVMKNDHVMPWGEWLSTRGEISKKTRKIRDRNFEQQADGSWVEK